jgi:putative OmpL-like beta-barrel porin-2
MNASTRKLHRITMALAGAISLIGVSAYAQTVQQAQTAPAAEPAKPPAAWADGITSSFWIEGGATFNSQRVDSDRNFGRLFDDRTDNFQLNQATYTLQRKIDSTLPTYDFGFKLQAMYGSDARYTHFLHEFQNAFGDSFNQFDIVEANVQAHTPWLTDGGFDIKAGQYPTLEGIETIDPTTNYLYSHSYIFNFGIPLKHTGFITVLHATPIIDLYAGMDTGVNTSLGQGDNNDRLAFHGGIGLNLLGGNLTVLATTHIGPENPTKSSNGSTLPAEANTKNRYLNDVSTTWKLNDNLTLLNDLNYIQDDCQAVGAVGASACTTARGYGVAQYAIYKLNDVFSLVGRAEVWRDEEGVFVGQFNDNLDFVRAENGDATKGRILNGGRTTYGGFTVGVNIKPPMTVPLASSFMIRPEVRYDTSLNNTKPRGDNTKRDQVTVASDFILQF